MNILERLLRYLARAPQGLDVGGKNQCHSRQNYKLQRFM